MNSNLLKLYGEVDRCSFCAAEKNTLQHIHGFGAIKPELMLVLVNPTHRNLSSSPTYTGQRFPFIGVRQFWRVLGDAGLLDKKISNSLPLRKEWTTAHTRDVQHELLKNKLFLTNVVKCCYDHSAYPQPKVIQTHIEYLKKEIQLVAPKRIIAFSGMVFKTLTGETIKLGSYWTNAERKEYREILSGKSIPVIPCYFPIGRGNPKKAMFALRTL